MDILTEREGSLLTIIFNRPQKRNAITAAMYQALADALQEAESDRGVRVILIQGQPQIFTSGNDLKDFLTCPPTGSDASVFQFMHRISQASKPIVAAVSGAAVGIGTTMLLHCDLVYAADNATFAMPFVRLGLCPEIASSLLLPQLVGYQRAAEKLLLGEPFDAKEAQAIGLINRVVPVTDLLNVARAQAAALIALPASALRATKRLMKAGQSALVTSRIADEADQFRRLLVSPEAREALNAFFEKRKPDFSHFD